MEYDKIEPKDNMDVERDDIIEVEEERIPKPKMVSAEVRKPKRGLFKRAVSSVAGPEGAKGVGSYIMQDIVLPALKSILADSINSGVNMVLFGDNTPTNTRHNNSFNNYNRGVSTNKTNYNTRYRAPAPQVVSRQPRQRPTRYVQDYIITDRQEAAEVLNELTHTADSFDDVSVADYYDLVGVDTTFTDHNYGWTIDSILTATIRSTREGYIIKFPPLELLK